MIATTGRGRWKDVHGPALGDGGPREGRLVWTAEEDGRQRPGVVHPGGAALAALAVEPAVYIDPASGARGGLARLNGSRAFSEWMSALFMPRPGSAAAG
jgi:hypothetical protein